MSEEFTHLDEQGHVHMVDVGDKQVTDRVAMAEAVVHMTSETRGKLFGGELPKGDALATARLAGIMAAKRTADLIPLCHPLSLTSVSVEVSEYDEGARVEARVQTRDRTGVEMEAMTAVAVAALALYDMVKGVERGVEITGVRLLSKSGGRSGEWRR
ncbi:MAG: cyclic pyranopterin monophosphate synthase MoaC [Actinobacteria bacterium]|nr:cyclic pyranopterin monophosphate synthase MoaC [Actinomycetota bacterium]